MVGILNLLSVHWRKITTEQDGSAYSFVLIARLILTIAVVGYFGPTADWSIWVLDEEYPAANRKQFDGIAGSDTGLCWGAIVGTAGLICWPSSFWGRSCFSIRDRFYSRT